MIPGRRYGLSDLPSILARRSAIAFLTFTLVVVAFAAVSMTAAHLRTRAENHRRAEARVAAVEPSSEPSGETQRARARLHTAESELQQADRTLELQESQIEALRQVSAASRTRIAAPDLTVAESRLATLTAAIERDRAELESLERHAAAPVTIPPPSPELKAAEAALAAAKSELAELQDRLTPQHPDVLAQQSEVADLQRSVTQLTPPPPLPVPARPSNQELAAITERIALAESEQRELQSRMSRLRRPIAEPAPEPAELAQLTREHDELRRMRATLDTGLAAARRELGEALAADKAAAAAAATIRAQALQPEVPAYPAAWQRTWPWAVPLAVFAALVVGFLAEVRDGRIRDVADLQATTDLPQLGAVSEIVPLSAAPPPAERELSTLPEPSSTTLIWHPRCPAKTVEQYRQVAHAIRRFRAERQARVIGVTSALAGEGKTLSSINLAVSLAESYRQRVVLIDADLRRPSVHTRFDLPAADGLTAWLKREDPPERVMTRMSSRLSIAPAGHPELNPVPLLTSLRMAMLIATARADFDWVIVDTPPAGLITDAGVLEGSLDGFLLIVAAGRTPYGLLRQAISTLGPERILGVVLNRTYRAKGAESDSYAPYHLGGRRSS